MYSTVQKQNFPAKI